MDFYIAFDKNSNTEFLLYRDNFEQKSTLAQKRLALFKKKYPKIYENTKNNIIAVCKTII